MAERITPRSEDYSRWYTDVIIQGRLADYSPVKGVWSSGQMVMPYGKACSRSWMGCLKKPVMLMPISRCLFRKVL